jgi:hypothetical protein
MSLFEFLALTLSFCLSVFIPFCPSFCLPFKKLLNPKVYLNSYQIVRSFWVFMSIRTPIIVQQWQWIIVVCKWPTCCFLKEIPSYWDILEAFDTKVLNIYFCVPHLATFIFNLY